MDGNTFEIFIIKSLTNDKSMISIYDNQRNASMTLMDSMNVLVVVGQFSNRTILQPDNLATGQFGTKIIKADNSASR